MDGIVINPDAFTIADMSLVMGLGNDPAVDNASIPAIVEMLNRVVVGGINHYPASRFHEVMAETMSQWSEAANPKA